MSPQPLQTLRSKSLHFFEEMFEPFIDQSRNITIRYQIQKEKNKNPDNLTIVVCSVNDAETPDDFHGKLKALTDISIQQVDMFLKQQNPAHIDALADYLVGKLDSMASIVGNHSILRQDELSGDFVQYQVKSFSGMRLVGSNIVDSQLLGPVIQYKTQKFTEVWLQVIQEAKDQVNLVRNMHKSVMIKNTSRYKSEDNKFKIKLNTSIDQETYLFFLLVKAGIIDLPKRKCTQLLNWMSENLQSINCESNTIDSVSNKYYVHELVTLDFWEQKCLDLLEIIHLEREDLTKFTPK
jgi:hypothetical protein